MLVTALVLGRPSLRFGYYSPDLSITGAYSDITSTGSIEAANETWSTHRVPSLLLVESTFFTQGPPFQPDKQATHKALLAAAGIQTILEDPPPKAPLILRHDWASAWEDLASAAAPLLSRGALLGFDLGDELVWNCLAPANLTLAANAVRARFPRGKAPAAAIWYNEARHPFDGPDPSKWRSQCGFVPDYRIPEALDWFSTDIYHMDGLVPHWIDLHVRAFYERWIYPNLTAYQSVILVPGSFGSDVNVDPNGTVICDRECYDAMCSHDAKDIYAWAKRDPRVVGVMPWNWNGCRSCNGTRWTPPHTCCMDEIGTKDMPRTRATWRALVQGYMDIQEARI